MVTKGGVGVGSIQKKAYVILEHPKLKMKQPKNIHTHENVKSTRS